MTNRTEVTPSQAEESTPAYQHLAPALPARSAGKAGEEMVMAFVPRRFEITLSDGTRQRVQFEVGNYPIPKRLKNHFYLKANGVTFGDEVEAVQKPQLEDGADPSKPAFAWPTQEEIAVAKFNDLGLLLKQAGYTDEQIRDNGWISTDTRRAGVAKLALAAAGTAGEDQTDPDAAK